MTYSTHKTKTVDEFTELIQNYPIIGAVDMDNLPAKQLQEMREKLRDICYIRMTKRRLINVALNQAQKENIQGLSEHLKGMPALLFTKENPFTLFKILKQNKSPAPAKGGQIAPKDIVVPSGATPFAPGPIIGELGKFGLKTGVEGGKVAIKQEKIVCKEGEVISPALAGLLTRLNIRPMEVGLALTAVYENGEILTKHVLDIDEEAYISELQAAAVGALNLSVHAAIPTTDTIQLILTTAARNARNLARESAYITADNSEELLSTAQLHVYALISHLPDEALSQELIAFKNAAPSTQATSEQTTSSQEEEKKDDDADEEGAAAAGMGALFG